MRTARKRLPGWLVEPTEDGWLILHAGGMPVSEIAAESGVTPRRVQLGLADARRREEGRAKAKPPARPNFSLVPMFGSSCKPLTQLTCDDVHPHGPIPVGSTLCCMAPDCHRSGMDHAKALQRDPRTDPRREPSRPVLHDEPTRAAKAGKPTSGKMARRRKAKKQPAANAA